MALAEFGSPSSISSSRTPPKPSWSCLSSSLNNAFLSLRLYLGLKPYVPSRTSIFGLFTSAWDWKMTKEVSARSYSCLHKYPYPLNYFTFFSFNATIIIFSIQLVPIRELPQRIIAFHFNLFCIFHSDSNTCRSSLTVSIHLFGLGLCLLLARSISKILLTMFPLSLCTCPNISIMHLVSRIMLNNLVRKSMATSHKHFHNSTGISLGPTDFPLCILFRAILISTFLIWSPSLVSGSSFLHSLLFSQLLKVLLPSTPQPFLTCDNICIPVFDQPHLFHILPSLISLSCQPVQIFFSFLCV